MAHGLTKEMMTDLANDWEEKTRYALWAWTACGFDVQDEISNKDGKYSVVQCARLLHPLEYAIEFRKLDCTDTDRGFRFETIYDEGIKKTLRGLRSFVYGPAKKEDLCDCGNAPSNKCTHPLLCRCRKVCDKKEEDPC